MTTLWAAWLGRAPYAPTFELQRALAERRAAGDIPDSVLLLEHDAVYTLGRRASESEILLDASGLAERGIDVQQSDRGGRVTYHGPGQLVGYPILDLGASGDLVAYVRALEQALIATVADFGIRAATIDGLTGVWIGDAKIAAIGVHVSRGITTHGFALNVDPDLDAFNGIIPCGIVDKSVTSIAAVRGSGVPIMLVVRRAAHHLARALDRELLWRHPSILSEATAHA